MPLPPKTLPADFFDNGPPPTLPADFFDKLDSQQANPEPARNPQPKPQAQPQAPRFGSRLYDSTVGTLGGLVDAYKRSESPTPFSRVMDAVVIQPAMSIGKRYMENPQKLNNPIARMAEAVVGPPVQQIADDFKSGNPGAAMGGVAGIATMMLGPKALAAGKAAIAPKIGTLRDLAAAGLEDAAAQQYARVVHATKEGPKYLSQKQVVPGLIERGVIAPTRKILANKASAQVESLGRAIGDYWDKLPDDASTPVQDIIGRIEADAQEAHTVVKPDGSRVPLGPEAQRALKTTEALTDTLKEIAVPDANGVPQVPVKRLREVRQYFDDIAARAKRYQGADLASQASAEIHGKVADAIRQEFAKQYPDLAEINKEFSFWKNVEKVTQDTILRKEGQAKPLTRQMAETAGALAGGAKSGPLGAVIGMKSLGLLAQLTESTGWRTVSAVSMDRLAKAIARGSKLDTEAAISRIQKEIKAGAE